MSDEELDETLALLADAADEREKNLYESGTDKLDRIGRAGKKIRDIEADVERLEQAIDDRKKELQELRTKIIPDLLRSVGMNSFTLSDGSVVELKDELYPDIPAAKRDQAFAWLRENGHGDLIRHEIKLSFGMGEDVEARAVHTLLANHNTPLNFTEKEAILPQSLRAWVREQERRGTNLPDEYFAVHRITTAQIKFPKTTKK